MEVTRRGKWTVRTLVAGGLVVCVTGNALVDASLEMPGVALGSPAILFLERTAVLFTAWLLLLVVLTQAWRGLLPVEISGRGVRYAEASRARESAANAEVTLLRHDIEIATLRREIADAVEVRPRR
jgi:hypothetical protein